MLSAALRHLHWYTDVACIFKVALSNHIMLQCSAPGSHRQVVAPLEVLQIWLLHAVHASGV